LKSIALFGGSFDPPHIGHIAVVDALLRVEYIDKVVVMPAFLNPFKSEVFASASLRIKWLKSIFKTYKRVEVSSFEIEQKEKVASIKSVKFLLKKYKKIYLVIGADNLKSLEKWYKYNELKELVTFIVASRKGIDIPNGFIKLKVNENVSSTELRAKIVTSKIPEICKNEIQKYYKEKNE